jgi:DNA-binding CsgD family transcriptional regulator
MTIETMPKRYHETLRLISEGHTNAEIGEIMFIGEETIKSRVKLLLKLFEARNRWHLVAIAMRRGVIT